MPPVLSADYAARRSAARETLTEILVADIGDTISKSPYLIVNFPSTFVPLILTCHSYATQTTTSPSMNHSVPTYQHLLSPFHLPSISIKHTIHISPRIQMYPLKRTTKAYKIPRTSPCELFRISEATAPSSSLADLLASSSRALGAHQRSSAFKELV